MVGEDLSEAATALLVGDGQVVAILMERDQEIDAVYREVEELVQREILLQAPVASDLRFLLSVLRIVPELERSHDLIVQIAASAGNAPAAGLSPSGLGMLTRMGQLAGEMWNQTSDCWYQRDSSTAGRLATEDRGMDDLHARLHPELAAGGRPVPAARALTLVARLSRRLGA